MKKIVYVVVGLVIFLVVAGFITKAVIEKITRDITEREIKRLSGGEADRITQTEIERITQEKTEEITRQIAGISSDAKSLPEVECNQKKLPRQFSSAPYYTGPLIDDHVHMPVFSTIVSTIAIQSGFEDMPAFDKELSIDYLVCLFDSEGIQKTFGFFLAPTPVFDSSVSKVSNIKEEYSNKIIAFYMPTPLSSIDPDSITVTKMLQEQSGLYQGLGEIKFAYDNLENDKPEDQKYLELYQIAADYQLIIMMHSQSDQLDAVKRLLEKYPGVSFLLHGIKEVRNEIGRLMDNHPNLYYSVDAELTSIYGWDAEHRGPTKEEYLAHMQDNFDAELIKNIQEWKVLIEKHPDRFLWGTDRWYRWHFEAEVGALIEEMGRSFIGQLNPAVQEKFAYTNAEKLIAGR